MKKATVILAILFSIISLQIVVSFAASKKPDVSVDPNTGDITYTFKNGPGVDEGKITNCPHNSSVTCKTIVVSGGSIVVGPSGYSDDATYVPAGSVIDLFIFTSPDPNIGSGYVGVTLLDDYYPNLDNETDFTQAPGQIVYNTYFEWEQEVY